MRHRTAMISDQVETMDQQFWNGLDYIPRISILPQKMQKADWGHQQPQTQQQQLSLVKKITEYFQKFHRQIRY
jgi:hypothetical protein